MPRRTSRAALPLLALLAAGVLTGPGATADATDRPGRSAGSSGSADRAPSPRWAEVTRIDGGFRYRASRHASNLTIHRSGGRVILHDRAMRRFRETLPAGCRRVAVQRGIAASCRIPGWAAGDNPLLVQIVPQAGDERVDGSTLGAIFTLVVQAAAGDDVAMGGAGDDQLDGGLGLDRMIGGAGRDRIRVGAGNDIADGGLGEDTLVGTDGADQLSGGEGEDVLRGDAGNDTLLGGPAADALLCGDGFDTTDDDGQTDGVRHCEQVLP